MPGVFKNWISSGVMGREHAYATSSSIGALSQCDCPAGSFLVDLRGETRFAGIAGGGGVTLAAGITGLPGAGLPWAADGNGATLAARIGLRAAGEPATGDADAAEGVGGTLVAITTGLPAPGPPGAAEGVGGIMAAGTTTLPAARSPGAVEGGGAILAARTLGLRAAGPPGALADGGAILAKRRTTALLAAGPPGAAEGGGGGTMAAGNVGSAGAGPPGDVEDGGVTMAADILMLPAARPPGDVGGITMVACTTGLSGAGPAGGFGPFRRRSGIAAGLSTGGATLTSAPAFGLGVVSLRRRLGMEAATRGAFAFPGRGAAFLVSSGGNGLPRRGTPRGSSQIHFTAPLPPSVRMKFFLSRRCISSITQRFEKPVSLCQRRNKIAAFPPVL